MMERIKEQDERVVQGAMVGKETIEHTLVDGMSSDVEVSINEVSLVLTNFLGYSSAPQVDEVPGDISIVDEELKV